MPQLAVVPDQERNVIVVQLLDDVGGKIGSIDLTPEMLAQHFAGLFSAYGAMNAKMGVPGAAGSWSDTPAIEGPVWAIGARPFDGAVTLSVCPAKLADQELWLTYAFQRQTAIQIREVLGKALARPTIAGLAQPN